MRVDQPSTPPSRSIEMSTRPSSELLYIPYLIASSYGLPASHLSLLTTSLIFYFHYNHDLSWLSILRNPRLWLTLPAADTTILLWMLYMSKHGFFANKSIVDSPSARKPKMEETPQEFSGQTSCPTTVMSRFNTQFRTQFHGSEPQVFGFPSSGGILTTRFDLAVAGFFDLFGWKSSSEQRIRMKKMHSAIVCGCSKWKGWKSEYGFVMKKIRIE
ncbi:unnamed protein product [Zymoseptoria tritici ST99CH_1E4]|uniref:Uncharacterized protein n=1 Tax=Zymoseptoria tritici ST99CH_1E4 TaxID=1276532 RepID=A0A2H1GK72_ZYMTR|nr:unnamed protein product [Zymoseptoria tritici ST99CH_1E4]